MFQCWNKRRQSRPLWFCFVNALHKTLMMMADRDDDAAPLMAAPIERRRGHEADGRASRPASEGIRRPFRCA
jgi:hypothetical protein